MTLSMPDNLKLLSCDVYEQSKDLASTITWDDREIIIKWDLFRVKEYIRLDLVADYDSSLGEYRHDKHSLLSKITFNKSRIQDLKVQKTNIRNYELFLRNLKTCVFVCLTVLFMSALLSRHETVKEFQVIVNNETRVGQLEFFNEGILIGESERANYPIVIDGIQEIEVNVGDLIPKSYSLFLIYIWGFVLLEQMRMRRKRVRYGLVSGKPWNQFDIEDC